MKRKSTLILGATLFVALLVTLAANAEIITSGLVGRWIFNEGSGIYANDSSSTGIRGTLNGSAMFITNDQQKGPVLNIYGPSGEVVYPFTDAFQPAIGTLMVWVNPSAMQLSDVVRMDTNVLANCSSLGGTFYAYDLRITSKGNAVAIVANDNPKNCKKSPQVVLQSPARQVKDNQWTHLAMRWDGSTLSLFVNGNSVASTKYVPDSTGLSYDSTSPLKVGAAVWDFNNGYLEYDGNLSDLRLYNRALTDTEINNIAANGQ
jgi:hypothetical protein